MLTQWGSPGLRSTSTPHTQPRLRILPCAPGVFLSRMGVLGASRGELSDLQGSPWTCFSRSSVPGMGFTLAYSLSSG